MQVVDVYIGTSLRGPVRGIGKCLYIMKTTLKSGKEYESAPEVMESEGNATESRLVLYALRDALMRMNFACEMVIHTECSYVASAITNNWPEAWRDNGWKNKKGAEVKESLLWAEILNLLEEGGHILSAEPGKHEYSGWMRWNIELVQAYPGVFTKIKTPAEQVSY